MNMKKGDCFLYPGEKYQKLYYITEVNGNKCRALSIYINKDTVQAIDCDSEYDLDLPDDIVMLDTSMYNEIKSLMRNCMDDMYKVLWEEALEVDFELEVGALYTDGAYIYRMMEIKENRWHYKLFRIEIENISYNWSGDCCIDDAKRGLRPITDQTLKKVENRFNELLATIDQHLNMPNKTKYRK